MSLNPIATQKEMAALDDALQLMAANLRQHADAPLGKAHGVQLVNGYVDIYGNDLTSYQDSVGNVVADKFVVFQVGSQLYYAPGKTSALAPQDSTVAEVASASAGPQPTSGDTALVMDYTSLEALHAANLNTLLLSHTNKPAASAHTPLTVIASPLVDAAGHTVGTHRLRFTFDTVVYEIPVSNRFGGPLQAPRGVSILTYFYDRYRHPRAVNLLVPTTVTGGSLPFTYQWQIQTNIGWENINPSPTDQSVSDGSKQVNILWTSTSTGTFTVVSCDPGNGNTHSFYFRVVVSNSAGSSISNTFQYRVTNTSSCFITTAVMCSLGRPDDCIELNVLRRFRDDYMLGTRDLATYYLMAPKIVDAINAQPDSCKIWEEVYTRHIQPAISAAQAGASAQAYAIYRNMVEELQQRWLR